MTNRYKLVSGPDDITWVSIQPLMEDISEQINDIIELESNDSNNMKLLGLRSTYQLLGALVTEKILEDTISNAKIYN